MPPSNLGAVLLTEYINLSLCSYACHTHTVTCSAWHKLSPPWEFTWLGKVWQFSGVLLVHIPLFCNCCWNSQPLMQILSNLWAKWLPTSDGLLLPNSTQRVGWLATSEFSSLSSLGYFNKLLPIRLIMKMPCCCFLTLLWSCLVGNSWSYSFLFGGWLKHKLRFQKSSLCSSYTMMYFVHVWCYPWECMCVNLCHTLMVSHPGVVKPLQHFSLLSISCCWGVREWLQFSPFCESAVCRFCSF